MARFVLVLCLELVSASSAAACAKSGSDRVSAGSVSSAPVASASRVPTVGNVPGVAPSYAPVASTAAPPSSAPASISTAPLVGPDGAPLPQTQDKPPLSSSAFRERIELVARAILSGDPAPAHAAFFPLAAYRQVKAIKDPDRDYDRRLLAAFDADVAEYHRALGSDAGAATFSGVDVPEARAEWMKPGREGNKVGYYRVLRSTLRFTLASGRERKLELTSMISWRGEWYVVHLHGFD